MIPPTQEFKNKDFPRGRDRKLTFRIIQPSMFQRIDQSRPSQSPGEECLYGFVSGLKDTDDRITF